MFATTTRLVLCEIATSG